MKKVGTYPFVVFLLYSVFVICTEWINLFSYFCGTDLPFGVAEIIALCVLFLLFLRTRTHLEFEPVSFNFEKLIGLLIIIGIGLFTSVYPDNSFDTGNYHLIAQNPVFENYFIEDYGYGNFQVWGFRLADRMFYYFRYLLGYRMGTVLNILIMALSFTQLYDLLDWILSAYKSNKKRWNIGKVVCNRLIWSFAILFSLDAILMLGTYYVDLFAVPLALEIIRLLLKESNEQTPIDIYYFALLNGIFLGFKLTNVVYVAPIVLFYTIKNFKIIKWKHWALAILIGVLPFLNYLIFNFVCTGNPVFPYFNNIFKSPYFQLSNWKDTRWGPKNLFEKLFWIFFAALKPEYRQSEIYNVKPAVLIIGLFAAIAMLAIFAIKKHGKVRYPMALILITLASTALWSFTTGYARYFLFGNILWGILAYYFLIDISQNRGGSVM